MLLFCLQVVDVVDCVKQGSRVYPPDQKEPFGIFVDVVVCVNPDSRLPAVPQAQVVQVVHLADGALVTAFGETKRLPGIVPGL